MVEPYLRRSALAHKSLAARASESHPDAGVKLGESPVPLHDQPARQSGRCGLHRRGAAGAGPRPADDTQPVATGMAVSPSFWLGPDEWLIVGAPGREAALAKELREALAGQHVSVVDVTEARTVIVVSGRHAPDTPAKGHAAGPASPRVPAGAHAPRPV